MPADSPRIGDRVTAYAPAWFVKNSNDYGAFQKLVLVPSDNVTVIPDSMTFNEASIFPLAVLTSWYSLITCGVERDASYGQADKQGILIWGVGGSVGSIALQIAKSLGFYIYATASQKHHAYLQTLGQGPGTVKLFDYKDKDVVHKIITAAKEDGVKVHRAIEAAAGNLKDCIRILRETKGDRSVTPKIAAAPFSLAMLWYRLLPTWWTGATVQFVHIVDDKQSAGFRFVFRTWLGPKLASGQLVPSPQIQVVPGGLAGIQAGLDIWSKGVSGVKLVVELP
jgi:hypothetical protein